MYAHTVLLFYTINFRLETLMKSIFKIMLLAAVLVICISFSVYAFETNSNISADVAGNNIYLQEINGEYYLLLPSFTDLENLIINVNGESSFEISGNKHAFSVENGSNTDILSISDLDANGKYFVSVKYDKTNIDFYIVKSANVSSMFITSEDPENYGREYVSQVLGNKAKGDLKMISSDGEIIYDGVLKEIKGRGNSTWEGSLKKPYQIKLEEKANLLNDGNKSNADKTWILLANSFDPTLIRNTLTYDLSCEIGMEFFPETDYVDLYYDGIYVGSYLLSEKNEIATGRVNVNNLEKQIENAALSDDITYSVDYNAYGNKYKYAEGVVIPDNANYGFLMEHEYADRVEEEKCWFSTTNGNYVVIKSPEELPKELMKKLSERFQEFEDAIYNGGVNPHNGKGIESYTDVDSLVKLFAIEQFSKDIDAFMASTYLYAEDDFVFRYGPVWDFDIAYGIGSNLEADENQKTTGFTVFNTEFGQKLMNIDVFNEKFTNFYNTTFSPIVDNVLLGEEKGKSLRSVDEYVSHISKTRYMNYLIWDYAGFNGCDVSWVFSDYDINVEYLKRFMESRNLWIKTAVNDNKCLDDIKRIDVYTYYDNTQDETYFSLGEQDYYVVKLLSADEENIVIKHLSGIEYSDELEVFVNGNKCEYFIDDAECVLIKTPLTHNIMPANSNKTVFKDVSNDDWHYEYVYNVYNNGWMKGVTEKRFQPDAYLKKGMVITALYRHSGAPDDKYKFTISSECYNDAASWAVNSGIISDYEKDYMEFSSNITRQEAAMMFYRAYGAPEVEYNLNFADNDRILHYYLPAIKWCVANGIFIGDNKNKVNPGNYLTRAEFTKMLTVYGNLTNK